MTKPPPLASPLWEELRLPPIPPMTLQMQMSLMAGRWLSSMPALLAAKQGLLPWSPSLQPRGESLKASLHGCDSAELMSSLNGVLAQSSLDTLEGVKRYQSISGSGYIGYMGLPYEVVWREAQSYLRYYRSTSDDASPAVFIVPSLINRSYILDLLPEHSLIEYLTRQGVDVYLLDWGGAGEKETGFTSNHYLSKRLLPALNELKDHPALTLCGYCMGGVLALAAALEVQDSLKGLALLSTPWDFSRTSFSSLLQESPYQQSLRLALAERPTIAADWLQMAFYMIDPWKFHDKYEQFAKMEEDSEQYAFFLALERWINDGMPLSSALVEECIDIWIDKNALVNKSWRPLGRCVDPALIEIPTFIALPENDSIVPPECSGVLLNGLAQSFVIRPKAGHVGMVIGHDAEKWLWEPLRAFVAS